MKGIATASKEWRHKAAGGVAFLLISTLVLTPANGEESTAQRRDRHAPIERLGHDYVYEITADLTPPETQEQLLNRSDLSESTRDGIERMNADGFTLLESIDGEKDFQAIVVEDAEGQKYIAFRGTELKSGWDVADDFGRIGIWQYDNNKARLDQLAAKYKDAIVTGHSLGGALAQRYTADHPGQVKEMVLFQSPGVDMATAEKYRAKTGGQIVPSYIYNAEGDLVSEYGGEVFLDSTVSISSSGFRDPLSHKNKKLLAKAAGEYVEVNSDTYNRNRGKNNISGLDAHLGALSALLPSVELRLAVLATKFYIRMPTYEDWRQIAAADQQVENILAELPDQGLTDEDRQKKERPQSASTAPQNNRSSPQRFERRKVPRLPGWND